MSETRETAEGVTRRRLFRAAASGSGTAAVGPAFVETATGRSEAPITTQAAVRSDAAAFGRDDYTGLLVHLVDTLDDVDTDSVERCRPFAGERLDGYAVAFVVGDGGTRTEPADLVVAERPGFDVGALCVVTDHRRCDAEYAQLTLERLSASRIESAAADESEAGIPAGQRPSSAGGAVGTVETPRNGLSTLAGVAGLGAALYLFSRRFGKR